MEKQKIQEKDLKYRVLIFNDQHTNSEIEQNLKGLEYHFKLSLSLSLTDQSKIDLITESLSDLNHLTGIRITFIKPENPSNNILTILKSLQRLYNLNELSFHFQNHPNQFIEETQNQLANNLNNLPLLYSFTTILSGFTLNNRNGQELFQKKFGNLNSLKQLRLKLNILDSESISNVNDFLVYINKLVNLTKLSLNIKSELFSEVIPFKYAFNCLHSLTDLDIKIRQLCETNISFLIAQIHSLNMLKKIKLFFFVRVIKGQLNQLFNTIFNLKLLEEFEFFESDIYVDSPIIVGEKVCEDSKLKIFKFKIWNRSKSGNTENIVLGKQMKNLKNLEVLSLELIHFNFSLESMSALSEWKNEGKQIKDLTIKNSYQEIKIDHSQLFAEITNAFSFAKQITKLYLHLNFEKLDSPIDVFSGISQLDNLESLSYLGLYDLKLNNFEEKYVNCFKKLLNLKELNLMNIKYDEELFCIGKSLQYLTGLVSFKINLLLTSNFEHFNIFCKNLKFLKKLNTFRFQSENIFSDECDFMQRDNIQLLMQGILELRALKSLTLFTEIQVKAYGIFKSELLVLISGLSDIISLTIPSPYYKKNQRNILRYCKRLVLKQV